MKLSTLHAQTEGRLLRNLRRRVDRARSFPDNTCPASRHVHMIADTLAKGRPYAMLDEEPEHVAGSLLLVLEALWKARTKIAQIEAVRCTLPLKRMGE